FGWLVAAAALAGEPVGPADAPPPPASPPAIIVEAAGTCPTGEAVRAALLPVLGASPVAAPSPPRVSDLGPRFEVVAAGQTGDFVDSVRDCVERARVAAVFIALALNPPVPPVRPPVVTSHPPPPPPAEVKPRQRWFSAAVMARFDGAEAGSSSQVEGTWGGEVRAALGRGALGIAATAGALAPTVTTFGSVGVRQQRFPLSVAFTVKRDLPARFRLAGDLGVAVVPFTLDGQGLDTAEPAMRVDLGGRLAVELSFPPVAGLTPVLGLHAEYFPRTYALAVDPLGDVGTSSTLWLGTSLGLAFETDRRR
ncbi:MAG TPA: hypothetical protein VKZ18_27415, partial [Polyangia bacterium]|nr:hypothetical protein [Polyangia bacterium]